MAEDITKGEIVRVIGRGLFKGQECLVLHIGYNEEHYGRFAETWYLLDTRYPGNSWSKPTYFERHEIESVEVEREAQG